MFLLSRRKTTVEAIELSATPMCDGCHIRSRCTTSPRGRTIERPAHQEHADRNNSRVIRYHNFYRLRQQIVEPVFGICKRQWHFDHVILKKKKNVETEVSIAAITYNLMRLLSVKGCKWVENSLKKAYFSLLGLLTLSGRSQVFYLGKLRIFLSCFFRPHIERLAV